MPSRFTNATPPLTETFSFAGDPFLREQSTGGGIGSRSLQSYIREVSNAIAPALSMPIRLAYGEGIQVTLAELSANIVSRSEFNYRPWGVHARLSLRTHFYELLTPARCLELTPRIVDAVVEEAGKDPSLGPQLTGVKDVLTGLVPKGPSPQYTQWRRLHDRTRRSLGKLGLASGIEATLMKLIRKYALVPMCCHSFLEDSRFAKYLGFVDVRPSQVESPIAMGLLGPPRALRHDPDVYIITGEYGRLFGGPAFPCSIFSMHDPDAGGARCAQACVVMGLGTLADRLAKVVGSYDITYLGSKPTALERSEENCLARAKDTTRILQIAGLSTTEIVELLQKKLRMKSEPPATNAHYFCESDSRTVRRKVARLVEAYLLARYPAILPVEASQWWDDEREPVGHAVLIVGMRRGNPANDGVIRGISELIVHDPGLRPFMRQPLDKCLDDCVALERFAERKCVQEEEGGSKPPEAEKPQAAPGGHVQLVFVTERRIQRPGHDCLDCIEINDYPAWEQFIYVPNTNVANPSPGSGPAGDFRIAIVHRRDILERLDLAAAMRKRVQEEGAALQDGWYWCVAGYVGTDLRKLWFFNVRSVLGERWDCCVELP